MHSDKPAFENSNFVDPLATHTQVHGACRLQRGNEARKPPLLRPVCLGRVYEERSAHGAWSSEEEPRLTRVASLANRQPCLSSVPNPILGHWSSTFKFSIHSSADWLLFLSTSLNLAVCPSSHSKHSRYGSCCCGRLPPKTPYPKDPSRLMATALATTLHPFVPKLLSLESQPATERSTNSDSSLSLS